MGYGENLLQGTYAGISLADRRRKRGIGIGGPGQHIAQSSPTATGSRPSRSEQPQMDFQEKQRQINQEMQADYDAKAKEETARHEAEVAKQQALDYDNAMNRFIGLDDPRGLIEYTNRYGDPDANLSDIRVNDDGSVTVVEGGSTSGGEATLNGISAQLPRQQQEAREHTFASKKDAYRQFFGKLRKPQGAGYERPTTPEFRQVITGNDGSIRALDEDNQLVDVKGRGPRQPVQTVDRGNVVDVYFDDGTMETREKGLTPEDRSSGNGGDGGGGRELPAGDAKALATFKTMDTTAKEIKDLVQKNSLLTGPADANIRAFGSYFIHDKDFEALQAKVGKLIETAYAMSGKQISEKELRMLEQRFLPNPRQPDGAFIDRLGGLRAWMREKEADLVDSYANAGYNMSRYRRDNYGQRGASGGWDDDQRGAAIKQEYPDAYRADDGNWYVERNGQVYLVED